MSTNNNINTDLDITKEGTGGLEGLSGVGGELSASAIAPELYMEDTPMDTLYGDEALRKALHQDVFIATGQNFGSSKYDSAIANIDEIKNLEHYRAQDQSFLAKVGNGLGKAGILAVTTFLQTPIGIAAGLGAMMDGDPNTSYAVNSFTKAMDDVNKWAEEALPHYYTDQQNNSAWYSASNLFSGNFLGDKLIKNLGFVVGAMGGGAAFSAVSNFIKLPNLIAKGILATPIAKSIGLVKHASKVPTTIASALGSTVSAIGEGSIQAASNTGMWYDEKAAAETEVFTKNMQDIEDLKSSNPEMYNMVSQSLLSQYTSKLEELKRTQIKMASMELGLNLPILLATNMYTFGKMYSKGVRTSRNNLGKLEREGNTFSTNKTKAKGIAAELKRGIPEGAEELLQGAAGEAASIWGDSYYAAQISPSSDDKAINKLKAMGRGFLDVTGDVDRWEEFAIGYITAYLGVPGIQSMKREDGTLRSPINWNNLAGSTYRDYMNTSAKEKELAEAMTALYNSPEANDRAKYLETILANEQFQKMYKGEVADVTFQQIMDEAMATGDEFAYKNAEHAQFLNKVLMHAKAGRLQDMHDQIEESYDTSDENLKAIYESLNVSETLPDGSTRIYNPFADKYGNPMYSTTAGKQEMIDRLTKAKEMMHKQINDYIEISENIDLNSNEVLEDSLLEELTWMKSSILNNEARQQTINTELLEVLNIVRDLYINAGVKDVSKLDGLINQFKKADKSGIVLLPDAAIQAIENTITSEFDAINSKLSEKDKSKAQTLDELLSKVEDYNRLGKRIKKYNERFRLFMSNPKKGVEELEAIKEKAIEETLIKFADTLNKISDPKDFGAFNEQLSAIKSIINDPIVFNRLLQKLEKHPLQKQIKEIEARKEQFKNYLLELTDEGLMTALSLVGGWFLDNGVDFTDVNLVDYITANRESLVAYLDSLKMDTSKENVDTLINVFVRDIAEFVHTIRGVQETVKEVPVDPTSTIPTNPVDNPETQDSNDLTSLSKIQGIPEPIYMEVKRVSKKLSDEDNKIFLSILQQVFSLTNIEASAEMLQSFIEAKDANYSAELSIVLQELQKIMEPLLVVPTEYVPEPAPSVGRREHISEAIVPEGFAARTFIDSFEGRAFAKSNENVAEESEIVFLVNTSVISDTQAQMGEKYRENNDFPIFMAVETTKEDALAIEIDGKRYVPIGAVPASNNDRNESSTHMTSKLREEIMEGYSTLNPTGEKGNIIIPTKEKYRISKIRARMEEMSPQNTPNTKIEDFFWNNFLESIKGTKEAAKWENITPKAKAAKIKFLINKFITEGVLVKQGGTDNSYVTLEFLQENLRGKEGAPESTFVSVYTTEYEKTLNAAGKDFITALRDFSAMYNSGEDSSMQIEEVLTFNDRVIHAVNKVSNIIDKHNATIIQNKKNKKKVESEIFYALKSAFFIRAKEGKENTGISVVFKDNKVVLSFLSQEAALNNEAPTVLTEFLVEAGGNILVEKANLAMMVRNLILNPAGNKNHFVYKWTVDYSNFTKASNAEPDLKVRKGAASTAASYLSSGILEVSRQSSTYNIDHIEIYTNSSAETIPTTEVETSDVASVASDSEAAPNMEIPTVEDASGVEIPTAIDNSIVDAVADSIIEGLDLGIEMENPAAEALAEIRESLNMDMEVPSLEDTLEDKIIDKYCKGD